MDEALAARLFAVFGDRDFCVRDVLRDRGACRLAGRVLGITRTRFKLQVEAAMAGLVGRSFPAEIGRVSVLSVGDKHTPRWRMMAFGRET